LYAKAAFNHQFNSRFGAGEEVDEEEVDEEELVLTSSSSSFCTLGLSTMGREVSGWNAGTWPSMGEEAGDTDASLSLIASGELKGDGFSTDWIATAGMGGDGMVKLYGGIGIKLGWLIP
jgi:hypothetical protein